MKVLRSFKYAFDGIGYCFKNEINFRVHCFAAIAAVGLSIAFHITRGEWIAILFAIALVFCLEVMNTVIEKLCDLVRPGPDQRVKVIKDMAAAAVLIGAIISLATGIIIFLPKFLA